MAILTWCLYLVVTLLISVPFVMFISATIFDLYFKYKAQYISKMLKAVGNGIGEWGEQIKKASAMVKKEKENG